MTFNSDFGLTLHEGWKLKFSRRRIFVGCNLVVTDGNNGLMTMFTISGKILEAMVFQDHYPDILTSLANGMLVIIMYMLSAKDQRIVFMSADPKINIISTIDYKHDGRVRSILGTSKTLY